MEKYITIIGLIFLVIIGFIFIRKKFVKKVDKNSISEIINLLGGSDNIVSIDKMLSRINIVVNNIDLVDANSIKNITNCGVMIVNNKVQIILNDSTYDFSDFNDLINK